MKRARKFTCVALGVCVVASIASAAWSYWSAHGAGSGTASVATLATPSATASLTAVPGTVHVSWAPGVTGPNGGPVTGYYVQHVGDGNVCGSPASLLPTTTLACDNTGLAAGTYSYQVTAVFNSFSSTSAASNSVVVVLDTTPPNAPVINSPQTSGANSGTFSNGVFNASTWGSGCTPPATICGTASDNVGGSGVQKTQLQIVGTSGANNGKYWTGIAFATGTPQFFDATGTTTWSYQLTLPADGGYSITARTIDNTANQSLSTFESVTIDTVGPTAGAPGVAAAVTSGSNPVFVKNESVNLTDSPSDVGGSGVRSVAYFSCVGASGSCTSATPWSSIGSTTTSAGSWPVTWSTPLPSDGPYRLVAVATDNAGNVSASSTATLVTIDTTPPTVSRPIVNGNP